MLRALLIAVSIAGLATAGTLGFIATRPAEKPVSAFLPFASGDVLKTALANAIDEFDAAVRKNDRLGRTTVLRRIDGLARKILAQAPANGEVWGILADVELKRGGRLEQALKHYELSYLTGRLEWPAIRRRLIFAMPAWADLPEQARATAQADIRTLLSPDQKHRAIAFLAELAKTSPAGAGVLRAAVVEMAPAWIKTFDNQSR